VKETDKELAEEQKPKKAPNKMVRMIVIGLLVTLGVILLTVIITVCVLISGGRSLRIEGLSIPSLGFLSQETELPEGVEWQEGWVRHDGKIYQYNEDIMTFLVLGIDQRGEVEENTEVAGGGQSDGIFLVILNPDEKDINILSINRDTMTSVKMYGVEFDGVTPEGLLQITNQYGFGNGMEESCERTRDAVSALLYDVPIHGYASIKMTAIPALNDAIGGVTVKIPEDMTKWREEWKKGAKVTLFGKEAYWYVRYRHLDKFESNRGRLERQKQYLQAFVKQAIEAVKKDITLPVTLYQELSKYMVTDVSLDEVAYLASELIDYKFSKKSMHSLDGTTVQGEEFEEFYPDKDALKETMIELFYEEVTFED